MLTKVLDQLKVNGNEKFQGLAQLIYDVIYGNNYIHTLQNCYYIEYNR